MSERNPRDPSRDFGHVSICVCTYKRARLLGNLLKAIQLQKTDGAFSLSIVVVDNDINRSAEASVASFARETSVYVGYFVEPVQNIALARNRAIRNAKGTYIAFIDDDEIPEESWLSTLFDALHRFRADVVLGPVLPLYETPPPRWVIGGKFCERPRYQTGMVIDWRKGRTGNILIKRKLFDNDRNLFDSDFGSGGEDQDFARRMIQQGYVFVWCNDARAYEIVPCSRWKRKNLLKRALIRGKMSARFPAYRPIVFAKAILAISSYALALPLFLVLDHGLFMKYLVKIFDHLGRLLALMKIDIVRQKYITG